MSLENKVGDFINELDDLYKKGISTREEKFWRNLALKGIDSVSSFLELSQRTPLITNVGFNNIPREGKFGLFLKQENLILEKYLKILQEAPLLVKLILDENIEDEYREEFAGELGIIKYAKAVPNLIEVGGHDLNPNLRKSCIFSIGRIGEVAYDYAKQIQEILRTEKDFFIKKEICRTLGRIKNSSSIESLMEVVEDFVYKCERNIIIITKYKNNSSDLISSPFSEDEIYKDSLFERITFQNALRAIYELDKELGRKLYKKYEVNISGIIRDSIKRTFIPH